MKRFLLLMWLFLPVLSYAQSNFRQGYVVTNSGDTLKGYIDYRERSANPSAVIFRSAPGMKSQNFNLQNCRGYGVKDLETFQRYLVDISMSRAEVTSLSIGPDSTSRRDTVFLKVLQTGKNVTLYQYRDEIKYRFYIRESDAAVPVELINLLYMNPDRPGSIVTENKYVGQLFRLTEKYGKGTGEDRSRLRSIRYADNEILKVVSLINDQHPAKSKYAKTRFFAGAGFSAGQAYYSGMTDLANDKALSKNSYSPVITAGIDIFANPAIGKLMYRVELSFMRSKHDLSATTTSQATARLSHSFDQLSAVLNPQLIYNLYNTKPLKVFLGAGFAVNLSTYSNNKSTRYNSFSQLEYTDDNAVELETYVVSFPFRAGIVINSKIELSAIYVLPTSITNYQGFNLYEKRFGIGINYLFGNH